MSSSSREKEEDENASGFPCNEISTRRFINTIKATNSTNTTKALIVYLFLFFILFYFIFLFFQLNTNTNTKTVTDTKVEKPH